MTPKFQQRHYEAIAEVIQSARGRLGDLAVSNGSQTVWSIAYRSGSVDALDHLEDLLTSLFKDDNGLFDADHFGAACQPGANVKARKAVTS